MARTQQPIDTLVAKEAELRIDLARLEAERGQAQAGHVEEIGAVPTRSLRRATSRRASKRRAEARTLKADTGARIVEFVAKHPGSTAGEVAKGLELPDEDGVFALDTYQDTPELVELLPKDLNMNSKTRKGIEVLTPLNASRANLELEGEHAKVHLHVNDPVIYLSLNVSDETEPVLSHPVTINTGNARAVNGGKHGAHSEKSGFAIVRVDERNQVRIVGAIKVGIDGKVTQDEDIIPTKVEVLAGKHWLRIEPEQKLTIGEYALVEIISANDINQSVWDFRVSPDAPDNPGSLGPILKRDTDR